MSDDRVLILQRVTNAGENVVPGSYKVPAACGHLSWIAPSGLQALVDRPDTVTRCGDCLDPADLSRAIEEGHIGIPPGAAAEIRGWYRRDR